MTNQNNHRRHWVNQTVSLEPDARRTRDQWKLLLGIVLAMLPFAFWLLEQNEHAWLSYRSSELRLEHERLVEESRRLRQVRNTYEALDEIERWAIERRQLVHPRADQIVIVRPSAHATRDLLARAPAALDTPR